MRFEDLAQDFVNDYRINGKRSLDNAERSVRYLGRIFGGLRAVDITTDKVRGFVRDRLDDGMSSAEINREVAALKRMFNLALRQTPPKVHQKPYIPMLQEQNARKGFFERQEFERLRTMLPQTYRAVVTFAYYSGWRKQEILGLAWDSSSGFATTGDKSSVVSKNNAGSMGTPSGIIGATPTGLSAAG